MKYLADVRQFLTALCIGILTSNLLVQPISAAVRTPEKGMAGQLTFSRQVVINGTEASAGQTVFNGNRVKVGPAGTAILNLGALGRIELGAGAEFTLRMADKTVGGELTAGCMNLSAPSGVAVMATGRDGAATADGAKPTAFWMGYKDGQTRVAPSLGEVRLMAGAKAGAAKTGEVATLATNPAGERTVTNRPAAEAGGPGAMCACATTTVPRTGTPGATRTAASSSSSAMVPILFMGVMYASMAALTIFAAQNGIQQSNIICIDSNSSIICKQVSTTVPNQ